MLSCLEVAACQILNVVLPVFPLLAKISWGIVRHRIKPPTVSQRHALQKRTVLKVEDTNNCYGLDLKSPPKAHALKVWSPEWNIIGNWDEQWRGYQDFSILLFPLLPVFREVGSSLHPTMIQCLDWKLNIHESNKTLIFVSWWSQLFILVTKPDQLMAHHQCLNLPFLDCLGIPQSLVSVCRKTESLGTWKSLSRDILLPSRDSGEKKLIFTFVSSCQLGIASELGMGACVHFRPQG